MSLSGLTGIKSITVTLDPAQAVVVFDPAKVTSEKMVQTINEETSFQSRVLLVETATLEDLKPKCRMFGLWCN